MALMEAAISDEIGVWNDNCRVAYPVHQLINILSIESMINELYESVCLKAAEQAVIKLRLLLSIASSIT